MLKKVIHVSYAFSCLVKYIGEDQLTKKDIHILFITCIVTHSLELQYLCCNYLM